MTLKSRLTKLMTPLTRVSAREDRRSRSVDLVLAAALQEPGVLAGLHYPAEHVEFLMDCIDHATCTVKEVRAEAPGAPRDAISARWVTLVDTLRSGLLPMDFATARSIALIADRYRALSDPLDYERWAGDTGLLFSIGSCSAKRGRILATVVRLTRSQSCLELGTFFGLSAMFILSALKAQGGKGHLATLEGSEPQFSVAAATLKDRYGDLVSCHFGNTETVLPELSRSLRTVDFLFHDAGHSREDYVRDFHALVGVLAPGSVVLLDDIRWDDRRFLDRPAETYRGWREIVAHPRVRRAVEVDGCMGLMLLR